jgi:hypothetical protein
MVACTQAVGCGAWRQCIFLSNRRRPPSELESLQHFRPIVRVEMIFLRQIALVGIRVLPETAIEVAWKSS